MRAAQTVAGSITSESALSAEAAPIGWSVSPEIAAALAELEGAARELDALQRDHRGAALAAVAPGKLSAADAFARIDAARRLDRIAHHAWRSAAHLLGRGAHADPGARPRPEDAANGRREDEPG
jgi:phosphate:Na+ symporter